MSENDANRVDDSAEKAYAAASEAVAEPASEKADAIADLDEPAPAEPELEAAPPVTTAAAPAPIPAPSAPETAPTAPAKTVAIKAALPKPALAKTRKPAASAKKASKVAAAKPATPAKRTAAAKTKPVRAKAAPAAAKAPAPAKAAVSAKAAPAKPKAPVSSKPPITALFKEKTMATKTSEFAEGIQKAAADAQVKAKKAFEKSAALFGEYGEFAKGNVTAVVESGKILAAGIQEIGTGFVSESRTALETATTDVKQLAAVKSPTEFIKLQSTILRRNVDTAVAYSSKNGEAVLKLASEAFKPITGRFSLALEKVRKAA